MKDYVIRATGASGQIRAFVGITTNMVEEARKLHETSKVATAALGRTLTATSMMGLMMKNKGDKLSVIIKGGGPIGTILTTSDVNGTVKGYVSNPKVEVPDYENGKLIVKEMVDLLCLELVEKGLVTSSITLHIGYNKHFEKPSAHGTARMSVTTSSAKRILSYVVELYERIMDRHTPIRRFSVTFNNVVDEAYTQYDLFTDPEEAERENRIQKAILDIKEKHGKNAILKGMNLQEGATTRERNLQIGGHRSGD